MRYQIVFLLLIASLIPWGAARAQEDEPPPPPAEILSPLAGEAVQGRTPILGTVRGDQLDAWELSFGYAQDETGTWFLIDRDESPVEAARLSEWDTSQITDGLYNLRLVVYLNDGSQFETIVPDIRVRNYTPIETSTPTITPTVLISPTPTPIPPTATTIPTPTPLPPNPAEITPHEFNNSLLRGALTSLGLFLLMGLYSSLRKSLRRRE
ncbi:MAG: hypothetical protein D6803_01095 [Anaerolineae bacterium]|nr:MAG: hypothetical protein D6803_01095 [Anaerolineae bacterium]